MSDNIPIPGAPTWYWLNVITTLQSMLLPTDPRNAQINALLFGEVDQVLLNIPDFCSNDQPPANIPVVADYESGDYVGMLVDYAKAYLYSQLCMENDILQQQTLIIETGDLQTLDTVPFAAGIAPPTGKCNVLSTVVYSYKFGTVDYDATGFQTQYSDGELASDASADVTGYGADQQGTMLGNPFSYPTADTNASDFYILAAAPPGTAGDGYLQVDLFYMVVDLPA